MPPEIAERQPFPGPGLSVRVVGEIRRDKLTSLKRATAIAEEKLAKHRPSQYFAVILDHFDRPDHPLVAKAKERTAQLLNVPSKNVSIIVFEDKATGVKEGERHYGEIAAVKIQTQEGRIHQLPTHDLVTLQSKVIEENPSLTRIFFVIQEAPSKQFYVVAIRAVQTEDFLTAKVAEIQWNTLNEIAKDILTACPNVSSVCYDVTPKPPATIEME
jgi:GMP synthase (glutamine-hydrolysing)